MHVGKADIVKWDEALEKNYRGDLTTGGDGTKESNSGSGLDPNEIALSDWGCPRTNITLDYPGLTITAETPPLPDEATAQWLRNTTATKDGTTFQFVPNNMLLSLNNPNGSLSSPWNQTDDVDRFTQALAYLAQKEDNLTLHDLVGTKNIVNFEQMAQRLYGRYMAQAFSNNMRVNFDKDTSNITLTDTLWTPSSSNYTSKVNARGAFASRKDAGEWQKRADGTVPTVPATLTRTAVGAHTRMVQNRSPKIALQVMLGFMAAGAILTKILLRTRGLLPHEPYSIAGRAVLVANGNMLQYDASGKEGSKEGQRYRLGLWKDRDGVERYGICVQE
ncbi:hypothetical protein N0V94_005704 [Neodidymelliopsis sp. IMI 364377]|nr:hypothetical protein N0V94_005704 [Neodidymelliopsis sp. IMI 364377]